MLGVVCQIVSFILLLINDLIDKIILKSGRYFLHLS